jgi:hypothetical protein
MSGIARHIAAMLEPETNPVGSRLPRSGARPSVAAAGHNLEAGLVEKRLQCGSLRTHCVSFCWGRHVSVLEVEIPRTSYTGP